MTPGLWGPLTALRWRRPASTARFTASLLGATAVVLATLAVGAVLLSLWVALDGTPLDWAQAPWWLVAVAALGLLLGTLFLYQALGRGPVSIVAPIAGAYPAF